MTFARIADGTTVPNGVGHVRRSAESFDPDAVARLAARHQQTGGMFGETVATTYVRLPAAGRWCAQMRREMFGAQAALGAGVCDGGLVAQFGCIAEVFGGAHRNDEAQRHIQAEDAAVTQHRHQRDDPGTAAGRPGDHADQLALSWTAFESEFRRLWPQRVDTFFDDAYLERFLRRVWSDSLGFAGTELIRRTIGYAHLTDLETLPDATAARHALLVGREVIVRRHELATPADVRELVEGLGHASGRTTP